MKNTKQQQTNMIPKQDLLTKEERDRIKKNDELLSEIIDKYLEEKAKEEADKKNTTLKSR